MSNNLEVEVVYFYARENSKSHKTDKFELIYDEENPIPIFRRGIKFTLALRFKNKSFDPQRDQLRLIFNFGPKPNVIKGTRGVIKVTKERTPTNDFKFWGANILDLSSDLILEVWAPTSAPVGIWTLQVESSIVNSSIPPSVYNHEGDFYILFNPWNCHDLVYMPEERLLDEYVLTDVGKIWVGPYGSSRGREWVFGQFDACVLPAAMLMFEKSDLPPASRGDPIKVSRMISKLVNSNDDDGVLVGRWDGEYDDGTAPSAWTGSVQILQEFLDTQSPVSYGQCWVFSGVVSTVCRALGIPSRVVSNLVSAHDANASLTVDKYYNIDNEEMDYDPNNPMGEDSIWNFHVWNDVWMARPDLPHGYGGWQAIDATPQETSSGYYQCGPSSLEAIKKGQVGFNYDVAFMVASVNADVMRWKEDNTRELGFARIYSNKYHVGRTILTKQAFIFDPNGDQDREDVTLQYKPPEGSKAERLSLYNAVRGTELAKSFFALPDPGLEDVEFDLEELERIKIGEGFCVVVHMKNRSDKVRNIKALLSATSVFYNGVKASLIKKEDIEVVLQPKSQETIRMTVKADEYLEKLVEYSNLKLYAIASVQETRQTWTDEDDFEVLKPKIDIRIPPEIPIGKPTPVTLRFVNPLKKILTNCRFNLSGPTLIRNQVIRYSDVKPGGLVKINADITPKIAGEQILVATFSSKQLIDIRGSAKVEVLEDEE
ncbi:hemocyte protein-glutamine gamma-glutamyltransferase [Tribolium castaneum]|uniref:protein-glutamine gamma-glutamyltransferase n=1 Tax=Tribolium castaneum TaxID=7070 RepID=D6WH00_TRICA|nr:PREDICTED: hemocyte protein-glutamine gamma-glutamyltransferase [Tribolium castaneum]EFA00611.1 Hemocyte protein-glutamine gamma-glutamyltransferase-like Protein [Tribolium castaneum]|eukprot:XP_974414.1 PREDICTED: hemocyte protein-glutamine gamma-glutamyltransferase [Tribolium castaneum]